MSVDSMVSSAHLSAIEALSVRVDGTLTAEEALAQGGLANWNIRKTPLFTVVDGKKLAVPGRAATVRDNPATGEPEFLGDVGEGYQIVQNEDHAGLLNALVDESGSNFEMAAAMDGGKRVFLSMKMPGHITVGGVDRIENSILGINSHDGSMSFTIMVAPVRYACANVLTSAFAERSNIIRIRHTSGLEANLRNKARQALDLAFNYLEGFQEEAEKMIQTTMTQSQFEEIIAKEFGVDEDASKWAATRAESKIEELMGLFTAQTQDGIHDTAWAGYNALTEWADHYSPTRGEDRDASRAAKALFEPGFKNRARELMLVGV